MSSTLYEEFKSTLVGKIQQDLGLSSPILIPRLEKVVVSMGLGEASRDKKVLELALEDLALIAGQKPIKTLAKRAEAGFKIRAGMVVGAKVTLRRKKMFIFVEKLINIAIPRIRDFRGFSYKSFDQNGNYSLGIDEQILFPEINPDKVTRQQGMNITFCVKNGQKGGGELLLRTLGFPLKRREN